MSVAERPEDDPGGFMSADESRSAFPAFLHWSLPHLANQQDHYAEAQRLHRHLPGTEDLGIDYIRKSYPLDCEIMF